MPTFLNRLQSGWNAFLGRDPTIHNYRDLGVGSTYRPDRNRFFLNNDRSVVSVVINRIGIDAASIDVRHVRLESDRYVETIDSRMNNALNFDANIDQTGRAFIQDAVESMCEDGVVAIVPTKTTKDPLSGSYDICEFRVGKVLEWYPKHVRVEVYNEDSGKREQLTLPKSIVALPQNPLYPVMNEPNSTLQRLKRTLANLDILDDRNASGKLDLIIQLPYVIKSQARKDMAESRRKEIEMQLVGSKYGIAYTDGAERIMQLNRPIENNYWTQAKELTSMLYSQLGLTPAVFDGSADERTMTNYYNRTIEPILAAITEEMERKFLSKNARTRGEAIRFYRDHFKLVTMESLASIANTLKQTEIASSNELRMVIGWKPSTDPRADELRNPNINPGFDATASPDALAAEEDSGDEEPMTDEEADELIKELQDEIDQLQTLKEEKEADGDDKSMEEINGILKELQEELDELLDLKDQQETNGEIQNG